jgi:CheY-like chemotaxis protein
MPTHVLVVDDDHDIRETLRLVLEDEGYEVSEAPDGAIALALLRLAEHPTIVLTNHNMPVLDGPGLLSFALSDPVLRSRHAFIYMTAANRIIAPDLAFTLNDLHAPVLRKPFDLKQLLDVVAQAARRLHPHLDTEDDGDRPRLLS